MQPTDDANFFFEWLKNAPPDSCTNVRYGVFGCGHPDWVSTYHHIPKTIDKLIHHAGGTRLVERGLGNAAVAELFDEFDEWEMKFLDSISDPTGSTGATPSLSISIDTTRREKVLQLEQMYSATVVSNDVISKGTEHNAKRHIEIRLSEGMSYKTGDYLNVLPTNPAQTVQRVLKRFNLHPDDLLTIKGTGRNLPVDTPVSAYELLSGFVELGQPATKKQVENLLAKAGEGAYREKLLRLTGGTAHEDEIVARRVSLLDLLEANEEIKMDLADFLMSLPPLRIRQVCHLKSSHR
jgi:cytochrome P450/NADPH-cytochrome P450 reductase